MVNPNCGECYDTGVVITKERRGKPCECITGQAMRRFYKSDDIELTVEKIGYE